MFVFWFRTVLQNCKDGYSIEFCLFFNYEARLVVKKEAWMQQSSSLQVDLNEFDELIVFSNFIYKIIGVHQMRFE